MISRLILTVFVVVLVIFVVLVFLTDLLIVLVLDVFFRVFPKLFWLFVGIRALLFESLSW